MTVLAEPDRRSPLLEALDAALAPGGPSALDPQVPHRVWWRALAGPASDFLARPGKALRARLVDAGWELGGGARGALPPALGTTVELLHAGSLIVDDVEDAADERRGAPALHTLVGTPLAINTGSWMYFWALGELAGAGLANADALAAQRAAIATMIRCHQGQALDLSARVGELDAAELPAVVAATTRLKTGALCRFAAELGAIAAGAPPPRRDAIAALGEAMGVALQMLDDLGGVAKPERRAKGLEDLRGGRPTWPWAWLAERADRFEWARFAARIRAVADGGGDPDALADALADAVASHGRRCARALVDDALAAASNALGDGPAVVEVTALLRGLEAHYA